MPVIYVSHNVIVTPPTFSGTYYLFCLPTEGWLRLSRPRYGSALRWLTRPKMVTHPGTNWAWRSDQDQCVTTKPNQQTV